MEIVRPVRLEDIDALFELTRRATHGLTSLQLKKPQLLERVEFAHFAFHRKSDQRVGEPYMLVMEDLTAGKLIGTSCVFARTGGYEPFYAYCLKHTHHYSPELNVSRENLALHLDRIHDGPTEIGSLFLLPEYRGGGRGRLLSLCRFALLAQRPHRFAKRVIAEMRGVCDEQGVSPFWEAIGRHFFQVDFPVADALSTWSKDFIEQLMPVHPIYVDLLPESARQVIGQVHQETVPAAQLLRSEGFVEAGLIDIFDGGPVLACETQHINAVQRCRRMIVDAIEPHLEGPAMIVASSTDGFRACWGVAEGHETDRVKLSAAVALALGVRLGSDVWVLPPKPNPDAPKTTSSEVDRTNLGGEI